jgi:CHASE2 domain-containing sensor protein
VSDLNRTIVAQDVTVSLSSVVGGTMLGGTVVFAGGLWWVAPVAAAIAGGLAAWSDRSRVGLWALLLAGGFAMVGVVWAWATDAVPIGVVPVVLVGMGVGTALNRVVFGLVWAVPDLRQRREQSA